MTKLLFLDVDGVLNTETTPGLDGLEDKCLELLWAIQKNTGCDIVLSSTWRKIPWAMDKLEIAFAGHGIPKWVGVTPFFIDGIRGDEIEKYLFDTNQLNATYAILDDNSDMKGHQLTHFFQTDPEFGLTKNIAYRVTYHLNHG